MYLAEAGWLAALLVPLGLIALYASRKDGAGRKLLVLRALALVFAVFALAGTSVFLPDSGSRTVLLFDVSRSLDSKARDAERAEALGLLDAAADRDRFAFISFAEKPVIISEMKSPSRIGEVLRDFEFTSSSDGRTDLAAAIATAQGLLAAYRGSRQIVLFSDGNANAGSDAVAIAEKSGIGVSVFPVGGSARGIRGLALEFPESVRPGRSFDLVWSLNSAAEQDVQAEISIDGLRVGQSVAHLVTGGNTLHFSVLAPAMGMHTISARIIDRQGRDSEVARSDSMLSVRSPPAILVASGGPSRVAAYLRAQGIAVRETNPREAAGSADPYATAPAIVLDNVPASALSADQSEAIVDYVEGGGGLVVVGGDSAFGRGEYFSSPLEDLLPVSTDTRQRLRFTRTKVLFVVDHSGSMGETVGTQSKLAAALSGIAGAVPELSPQDEVGIMGFDIVPQWILPFTFASEKQKIVAALRTMPEGGGTDLGAAIAEVLRGFGSPGPVRRVVILMSDGLTNQANFEEMARRLQTVDVSVSTIAIGDEVNEDLLRNIASWTGGTYSRATVDQLPRVINRETVQMTRDLIQEGYFPVSVESGGSLITGIDSNLPPLDGYVVTRLKPLAKNYIVSSDNADPILAAWNYGSGKVAAFTSDSGTRWAGAWNSQFGSLWSRIIRSVERADSENPLSASTWMEGAYAVVSVDAIGPDRRLAGGLSLRARTQGPSRSSESFSFPLTETALGHYEGRFPLTESGLVRFDVEGSGRTGSTWLWTGPLGEEADAGINTPLLMRIASASGGRVLSSGLTRLPRDGDSLTAVNVSPALLIAALILFLFEMGFRSTVLGQLKSFRRLVVAWWQGQKDLIARLSGGLRGQAPGTGFPEGEITAQQRKVEAAYRELAARKSRSSAKDETTRSGV